MENKLIKWIDKEFFEIKNLLTNIFVIISMFIISMLIKIGFILNEEIFNDNAFQIWIWAILIFLLIELFVFLYRYLEGFFYLNSLLITLSILSPYSTIYYKIFVIFLSLCILSLFIKKLKEKLTKFRQPKQKVKRRK